MRLILVALVAASAGAFLATALGRWAVFWREDEPLTRFVEPLGDEVTIETSDGTGTYRFRGHLLREDDDGVQPVDPYTFEFLGGESVTVPGYDPTVSAWFR